MATLIFFGKLSDIAGQMTEELDLPESVGDTDALCTWLETMRGWEGVLSAPTVRIALNDEIITGSSPISNSDSIAFLPPVGGG